MDFLFRELSKHIQAYYYTAYQYNGTNFPNHNGRPYRNIQSPQFPAPDLSSNLSSKSYTSFFAIGASSMVTQQQNMPPYSSGGTKNTNHIPVGYTNFTEGNTSIQSYDPRRYWSYRRHSQVSFLHTEKMIGVSLVVK